MSHSSDEYLTADEGEELPPTVKENVQQTGEREEMPPRKVERSWLNNYPYHDYVSCQFHGNKL